MSLPKCSILARGGEPPNLARDLRALGDLRRGLGFLSDVCLDLDLGDLCLDLDLNDLCDLDCVFDLYLGAIYYVAKFFFLNVPTSQ